MTVRFASARCAARSPLARVLSRGEIGAAANDSEGQEARKIMSDTTKAALLHFAEHGLRAVPVALTNATLAASAAHEEDYRHWLGICRALDRRAALRVEAGLLAEDERLIG